jgi:hypothetical protein
MLSSSTKPSPARPSPFCAISEIDKVGLSSGQHSTYDYTTTPENFITGITETSDTSTVYPTATTQTASYNNLNQITDLSGQSLTWDADGNLLSDGARTYTWDAENRLVGIGYPGVSDLLTENSAGNTRFDALSRLAEQAIPLVWVTGRGARHAL